MSPGAWIRDFPDAVVRLRGVTKRYRGGWRQREVQALRGLDLAVPGGAVYAVVGPNGAGKSTTMRLLLDLARPTSGEVRVLGAAPAASPGLRGRIGYVPERHDWAYADWSAGDALRYHRRLYSRWDAAYACRLDGVLRIDRDRRLARSSKGEARRVQLLLALAPRPDLLLLDEPTDGLDPVVRDEVWGVLADYLADSGATALVATHHVHEVERLATHYGALREGRIVAQLATEDVRAGVREYHLAVPDAWRPPGALNGSAIAGRRRAGQAVYTAIGEEAAIAEQFRGSGAEVLEIHRPTLEETTLRLLAHASQEAES
jgi:ABC-2 type transport system ATP-binding protein